MKLVLNNVLNLLGTSMLPLAIWNVYLFVHILLPHCKKTKISDKTTKRTDRQTQNPNNNEQARNVASPPLFGQSFWGRDAAKSQPLLFGAVLLLSLKCSARVQSEGGQEGSFGPVFLRFLRFQKLQTWIIPNSTSVADTGQSGEKGKKKREGK